MAQVASSVSKIECWVRKDCQAIKPLLSPLTVLTTISNGTTEVYGSAEEEEWNYWRQLNNWRVLHQQIETTDLTRHFISSFCSADWRLSSCDQSAEEQSAAVWSSWQQLHFRSFQPPKTLVYYYLIVCIVSMLPLAILNIITSSNLVQQACNRKSINSELRLTILYSEVQKYYNTLKLCCYSDPKYYISILASYWEYIELLIY